MTRRADLCQKILAHMEQQPDADMVFVAVSRVSDIKTQSEMFSAATPDGLMIDAICILQAALDMSIEGDCTDCPACQARAGMIRKALTAFPRDLVGHQINDAIGATVGCA